MYVLSPAGLQFEVCVDPENVEEIREERSGRAHEDLAKWLAGDHEPNHDWGGRAAPQFFPGRLLYQPAKQEA
jgi:hypothetical protein